ncbi:hypothetical protein [Pseudoalteromonas sp. MMG022]|uniref:hypothetical protein n=1 Tax=Pseudoalteromonas sp. MMG022 TaxID=2909978 RepID=UPI001F38992D|nr:hypothetical protein [Pseudoalteromonas sp. MMG022]MCF6434243.1 hypothetical protein [Pseudoalteromonas sp. MMG022]
MTDLRQFGNSAKNLSKNPVGILALFIVPIYSFAALVITFSSNLQADERKIIIWFIVIFSLLVLATYVWLVTCHHEKFYSPNDFSNEDNFVKLTNAVRGNLQKDISEEVINQINLRIEQAEKHLEYERCYLRMYTYKLQGLHETAIAWMDELLKLSESSEILALKAYSLSCLELYSEALSCAIDSIRLNDFKNASDIAAVYYNSAYYKAKLNRPLSELEEDLKKSYSLESKFIEHSLNDDDLRNYDIKSVVAEYNKSMQPASNESAD